MNKLQKQMWKRVAKFLKVSIVEMQCAGWEFIDVIDLHSRLFGGTK